MKLIKPRELIAYGIVRMKLTIPDIIVLIIAAGAIPFFQGCDGASPLHDHQNVNEIGFLAISGANLFDEKGNEIILRGVDAGPFPYFSFKGEDYKGVYSTEKINGFNKNLYSAYLTEQDMIKTKEMGVNVIRAHISFYDLEVEPYKYNEGALWQLDYLLNLSSKYGIYVIPVMSDAAQNSEQQLAHPDSAVSKAYNSKEHLWTEPEFQKRALAAWKHIAKRYANNPGIAGYDIINEPSAPTKEDLRSFYSEVISEIRKVDTKHIIILERQHFHNATEFLFGGIYHQDNIMLSLHHYADEKLEGEANPKANYESYDLLHKRMGCFLKMEEVKGRPLYVGEFGIAFAKDEAYEWLDNMMQVMNSYGIHYTYFSYKNIYGYWDRLKGEDGKGLYRSTEPVFLGVQDIPKEKVIDWAEERREDQLSTERFQIDLKIKKILKKRLVTIHHGSQ